MSKQHSPQEKASIVTEFFTTNIYAADLCRKHSVLPTAFIVCSSWTVQLHKPKQLRSYQMHEAA